MLNTGRSHSDSGEHSEPPSRSAATGRGRRMSPERQSSSGVGSEHSPMTDYTLPTSAPSKYRSRTRAAFRFFLQRVLFRGLVRSTITQTVTIAPAVRRLNGGFLVIANHTSHLDAPIIAQSLPRNQSRFLATGVAYDYFFLSWHKRLFVRWLFNAFPIYRDAARGSAKIPRALLRSGVPVLLFPEGGRQKNGTIANFKAGSIRLAVDAGVPIVPTAVIGGFEAMPKGRSWPVSGRPPVRVVFGEPVVARPEESLAALTSRVRHVVEKLFAAGAADIGVRSEHTVMDERTKN